MCARPSTTAHRATTSRTALQRSTAGLRRRTQQTSPTHAVSSRRSTASTVSGLGRGVVGKARSREAAELISACLGWSATRLTSTCTPGSARRSAMWTQTALRRRSALSRIARQVVLTSTASTSRLQVRAVEQTPTPAHAGCARTGCRVSTKCAQCRPRPPLRLLRLATRRVRRLCRALLAGVVTSPKHVA